MPAQRILRGVPGGIGTEKSNLRLRPRDAQIITGQNS